MRVLMQAVRYLNGNMRPLHQTSDSFNLEIRQRSSG